jgi:hypothetical protein
VSTAVSTQYRIVVGKNDERVDGPDDAAVVITVPLDVATSAGFDPAVEFMRGRLKAAGPSGALFELFRSGDAAAAISRLASPS